MLRRVVHIVENLDRGAVENWLVRMLRHARKQEIKVDWTFYCALGQPGLLDDEVKSLGAKIIYSTVPIGKKIHFLAALRTNLRGGQYDILHCHHDLVSAMYLLASVGIPIRKRVVHVHNADENLLTSNRLKLFLFREPFRLINLLMADHIVGISRHTLNTFLADYKPRAKRDKVLYYGVDTRRFEQDVSDRIGFRRNLALPENALILLFGGRLVPEKNPLFAIEVLADLRLREPRAFGVFAGAGSLEERVMVKARELGVENFVRLLGWRRDLPEIMGCCDWFILPHPEEKKEGFGLAVVEAQLGGLRLLLSMGVADDPLLPTACYQRLPLSAGTGAWAEAAMDLLAGPVPSKKQALAALKASPMEMDQALDNLLRLYE